MLTDDPRGESAWSWSLSLQLWLPLLLHGLDQTLLFLDLTFYVCIGCYVCIHIYIYIYRERERDIYIYMYREREIDRYMYMFASLFYSSGRHFCFLDLIRELKSQRQNRGRTEAEQRQNRGRTEAESPLFFQCTIGREGCHFCFLDLIRELKSDSPSSVRPMGTDMR